MVFHVFTGPSWAVGDKEQKERGRRERAEGGRERRAGEGEWEREIRRSFNVGDLAVSGFADEGDVVEVLFVSNGKVSEDGAEGLLRTDVEALLLIQQDGPDHIVHEAMLVHVDQLSDLVGVSFVDVDQIRAIHSPIKPKHTKTPLVSLHLCN